MEAGRVALGENEPDLAACRECLGVRLWPVMTVEPTPKADKKARRIGQGVTDRGWKFPPWLPKPKLRPLPPGVLTVRPKPTVLDPEAPVIYPQPDGSIWARSDFKADGPFCAWPRRV
jgi:hypothetical protein